MKSMGQPAEQAAWPGSHSALWLLVGPGYSGHPHSISFNPHTYLGPCYPVQRLRLREAK